MLSQVLRCRSIQVRQNTFHHTVEILIDIRIPEPQNSESLCVQKLIANPIGPDTFRQSVLATICLDHKPRAERQEVDNVSTNRRLTAKVIAEAFQISELDP